MNIEYVCEEGGGYLHHIVGRGSGLTAPHPRKANSQHCQLSHCSHSEAEAAFNHASGGQSL